jgi:hypothetical protein
MWLDTVLPFRGLEQRVLRPALFRVGPRHGLEIFADAAQQVRHVQRRR